MKLQSLANHRAVFLTLRTALLLTILGSGATILIITTYFTRQLGSLSQKVYVLDGQGDGILAFAKTLERTDYQLVARDHVRDFYELFFSFDQYNFQAKTQRALFMIGKSGKKLMEDYKKDKVLRDLMLTNARVSIHIEQIKVDVSNLEVLKAQVKAVQTSRVGRRSISRRMDSNVFHIYPGYSRNPQNVHGMLIEDFSIQNKEVIE